MTAESDPPAIAAAAAVDGTSKANLPVIKKDKKDKEKKEKKDKSEKKEKKDKSEKKEKKQKTDKSEKKEKSEKKKDKKLIKEEKKQKIQEMREKMRIAKIATPAVKTSTSSTFVSASRFGGLGLKKKLKKKASGPATAPRALVKTEGDYEPMNRWWEKTDYSSGKRGGQKWDKFEHHGVMFPDPFERHNVPLYYDGKPVQLSDAAEELATYYASTMGSDYEKKAVFCKNFWDSFLKVLGPDDPPLKEFELCDFSKIKAHLVKKREQRLDRPREEKLAEKEKNDKIDEYWSYALMDGYRERVSSFKMEPPQLFRGRGEHPKQGQLKKRYFPEDVTINIGKDSCVPKVPPDMVGHAWCDVLHENTVQWLACFHDPITGGDKHVTLAAQSSLKGMPDMLKYERARRLKNKVKTIRNSYEHMLTSQKENLQQIATATYFIDKLALRVGGEKDTEEEADTVGCCNLRCEHLTLEANPEDVKEPFKVHFDFLGKDSIQYTNTVAVTQQVFRNLEAFKKGKGPTQQLFNLIQPKDVNEYFKEFMEDLSAKVFRTFNASFTLQAELSKIDAANVDTDNPNEVLAFYNEANRQVAILCNHQKAVSKQHDETMEKLRGQQRALERNIKILKKHYQWLSANPKNRGPEVKVPAGMRLPKDAKVCKQKVMEGKARLERHTTLMEMKESNKTVSLGTSKVNYMDPRITVAFCKKVDLPIEKVFQKGIRVKFPWAMHSRSDYVF
eukprot:gnl/MRDRNA2_/MRDRNA2_88989_c0_seq1.p1 gnl/MRDRNA2_/MRDRNA2_88989_c0~~gnl/MRDRNA2_/MRDRNA2_88989_c0_seq1.p1  ORF type:complete len:751 (+),score=185.09 gnl/MRDRNA2_/MRDRNA2_88989_c0_seq1:64-2253(+)